MRLLRPLILRPLGRDPLRTALSVLSVALGIAVIVAIDLAGDAATGSFRASMETLVGKTDLEILANGGIDEQWIGRLDALPLNAAFAPLLEGQALMDDGSQLPLYGVDLVAHADEAGKPAGPKSVTATVGGRRQELKPAQLLHAASGDMVVADIATAQQALHRFGKLDRIDVTIQPGEDLGRVEQAIRAVLPPSYLVERPGVRSDENQRMLRAFRWNLQVLGYISLVVGAFLIYNTISISVVRRRGEIGVLRALGAGRSTVMGLFLAEALLLGVAGAVLGVALGRLLAGVTVRSISETVNALYTTSRPTPVALTAREAWIGLWTGALVALGSAFAPAREAMLVSPVEAMGRGAHEHHARLRWRRGLAWAAVLAAASLAASQARPARGYPVGGYAAALLAIGAAACAAPGLVLAANYLTRAVTRRRVASLLAGRSLTASLSRSAVVVAALATAIAMMASVGIMVGSFRETVVLWLDVQLRADFYLRPAGSTGAGDFPALDGRVEAAIESIPGVAAVDAFHGMELHFRGERATLGAGNLEVVRRFGRLRFLVGEDRDAILRSLPGRDRAVVSEPFALRHGVHAGDQITIPIGAQNVRLTVAGIYYDYSSSQGYVILDNSTLLRYLPNQAATNAAVYLAPGADAAAVLRALRMRTAPYVVTIAANSELRRASMVVFDRTFAITWALEAVAILVAMLGAANSLLALVLDRRRELGLLRYLGASTAQIRGMILVEAGFLGILAAILGLALGCALSLLLIFVVNKQSFGWTIQFHPPQELLAGALALVWCVTVIAGLYPARVASRLNPIDVIHEE